MATVRSRMARRGRTGRKASTKQHVKRAVQVHKHHHRRYAGTKGGSAAPKRRKAGVTTAKRHRKTGLHRTFKGRSARGHARAYTRKGRHGHRKFHGRRHPVNKRHVRKGLHRHFKGRRHTTRHVRKGLHRKFHGRHYHGRHVKPGQHRRFLGRKTTHHKGHIRAAKPKAAPISSASYLSMF